MNNYLFCSFIVLLAMLSHVTNCQIRSLVIHDEQVFWRKALPFLNETFVQYCYFGQDLTSNGFGTDRPDYYCELIANKAENCYIAPQFLEPMQEQFAKLVANNAKVNDHLQVLECYAKHRSMEQAKLATCWMVDSTSNSSNNDASTINLNQTSVRQQYSKVYFDRLSEVSNKIDKCLRTKNCHNPRDDFLLALHCALYHSKNNSYIHLPCEATKFVQPTTPPMDDQTIVRYFGHINGSSIDPAAMFENIPEAAKPYKTLLVSCFAHEEAWIDDRNHECRNITVPVNGVVYSERDRMLQDIFQNVCCRV